jgi:hypothetical protein
LIVIEVSKVFQMLNHQPQNQKNNPLFIAKLTTIQKQLRQAFSTMNNNQQQNSENNPLLTAKLTIIEERVRQARHSFNFALVSAGTYVLISITGAGLLMFNQTTEAAVTTASGLVTSVGCLQIAKDANNRLDKILAELDEPLGGGT